jgi:hypothetical protein
MISRRKGLLKEFSVWRVSMFDKIDKPNRRRINPLVRNRIIEAQLMLEEQVGEVPTVRNDLTRSLAG